MNSRHSIIEAENLKYAPLYVTVILVSRVFLFRYPRFQLASITNTENIDIGRIYTPDTQNSENINPGSENATGDKEEIQEVKRFNLFISTFKCFPNVYVALRYHEIVIEFRRSRLGPGSLAWLIKRCYAG